RCSTAPTCRPVCCSLRTPASRTAPPAATSPAAPDAASFFLQGSGHGLGGTTKDPQRPGDRELVERAGVDRAPDDVPRGPATVRGVLEDVVHGSQPARDDVRRERRV